MPHALGQIGKGIRVAYSEDSPVSWTKVPQVLDATVPTFVSDDVDVTTHDTSGRFKKTIAGLTTVGDVTITVLADFNDTNVPAYGRLMNANLDGDILWFRVEMPANAAQTLFKAFEFQGGVKSYEPQSPIAGRQEIRYVVKFAGDDVGIYAAGASAIS